ncbi:MAG: UvrD-helicase domain-containing protein, partial [Gammaproteobacteria bacterium]
MTQVFDAPQRQRALDTGTSFIVQAPAGSGKTELLTQRYLALLANVEQPEAVLAITFTRKAASEMRERIIHALNKAKHSSQPANEPDHTSWRLAKQVLNSDERLQWQLLKNPQRLQIQTIDSFNSTLVKRMPSLSGLGADIKTVEDAESLYQMAAERTLGLLDDADHGDAVANYLLHLDGNRTRAQNLLIEMLKCRDQWTSRINKQGYEVEFRQYIEDSLVKVIEDEMSDLHDMLNQSEIGRINTLANFALEILRASDVDTHFKAKYHSDESYSLEPLSLANFNDWRDISAWLLKAGNEALLASFDKRRGFPAVSNGVGDEEKALFKERKAQITELAQELIPREAFFTRVSQLPNPEFTESEWQHLSDLIRCLKLALGQLRLIFTERDRLDFQEVAIRASEALD